MYPVRPTQCKTFPWWPQHLKDKEDWEKLQADCEGINHPEAEITSCKKIKNKFISKLNQANLGENNVLRPFL